MDETVVNRTEQFHQAILAPNDGHRADASRQMTAAFHNKRRPFQDGIDTLHHT